STRALVQLKTPEGEVVEEDPKVDIQPVHHNNLKNKVKRSCASGPKGASNRRRGAARATGVQKFALHERLDAAMKINPSLRWSSFVVSAWFLALIAAMPVLAQDAPPGRVARLSYSQGTVSLQLSGANQWNQASLNYPLTTGDRLYT